MSEASCGPRSFAFVPEREYDTIDLIRRDLVRAGIRCCAHDDGEIESILEEPVHMALALSGENRRRTMRATKPVLLVDDLPSTHWSNMGKFMMVSHGFSPSCRRCASRTTTR